jgi:hypothetical protein
MSAHEPIHAHLKLTRIEEVREPRLDDPELTLEPRDGNRYP